MIRSAAIARLIAALLVAGLASPACDREGEIQSEDVEQDLGPMPEETPAPDSAETPDTTPPEPMPPSGTEDGEWHLAAQHRAKTSR